MLELAPSATADQPGKGGDVRRHGRRPDARPDHRGRLRHRDIFSIAGIGRYFVVAVQARDDGVVMGLTVVITLTIIVGNLVVDVVYALLDPRLRDRR